MRALVLRHAWWVGGLPGLLLVLPPETASALAVPIFVGALVAAARALRRQPTVPDGFRYMYAAALVLFLAVLVRAAHAGASGLDFPYPSPADLISVIGYVFAILGAVSIARARRAFGSLKAMDKTSG